jgi:chitin disaccharide deacetylase
MPRLLIVNADDFGLSPGVNAGIIEAHAGGVVTSTSLMVDRPGAEDAAELAQRHPALSVGLHFDDLGVNFEDRAGVVRAFAAQLGRFRQLLGAEPTHVDSHHHSHAQADRIALFSELVDPLGVPLRHSGRVRYLGGFWGQSDAGATELDRVRPEALLEMVRTEVLDGINEIGCHPARLTGDFASSYLAERQTELETLTAPGLAAEIEARGVELVSFARAQASAAPGL